MISHVNIFVTFSGIIHPMMMNDGIAMASAPGVSVMLRKNVIMLPPPEGGSSPQDVKIRKDFPESFIFEDFDEAGLVTSSTSHVDFCVRHKSLRFFHNFPKRGKYQFFRERLGFNINCMSKFTSWTSQVSSN